jgi:hypothetical protein
VAYINLEMDKEDWLDVLRAMPAWAYNRDRICALHLRGQPFPVITSPAARAWFVEWLRERAIEVAVLDPWNQLCAKNGVRRLNDDGEVLEVLMGLDEIKAAAGVSSLYIPVHMPHQTGESHLERFKGAGALGDWADTTWSFTTDEEGTRYLGAVGRARIDFTSRALNYDHASGLLTWGSSGTRAQTKAGRQRDRMLAALAEAGADGLLTGGLMDAAGGHTETARKMAADMVRGNEVASRPAGGRAVRYWLAGNEPPLSVQESGPGSD